jgi:hypothetical protein
MNGIFKWYYKRKRLDDLPRKSIQPVTRKQCRKRYRTDDLILSIVVLPVYVIFDSARADEFT